MAAYQVNNGRNRFRYTYYRRRMRPMTPPQTSEIISYKPRIFDDHSDEEIDREEKVHLEDGTKERKKVELGEFEKIINKIKNGKDDIESGQNKDQSAQVDDNMKGNLNDNEASGRAQDE